MSERTAAQEAELAALIAEQEADDNYRVWGRDLSLDASLVSDSEFSLLDTIGEQDERLLDLVGDNETFVRLVTTKDVSDEDVRLWRYLRIRQGWSYQRIADHAGVHLNTVLRHISGRRTRASAQMFQLRQNEKRAVRAYDAGAKLIEVAQVLYRDAGYKTPESCYQALRRLFLMRGRAIRPKAWKHGRRSRSASREVYIAYWKEQNRKAAERRRAALERCQATTRKGTQCSRWARTGHRVCNVHAGLSGGPTVWKPEVILDALNEWNEQHGRYPRPRDWQSASVEHPSFRTVYGRFSSWDRALEKARLRSYRRTAA